MSSSLAPHAFINPSLQSFERDTWALGCLFFPKCSKRVPLSLWGLGVGLCSLNVAFVFATVRNRSQPFATVRNCSQPFATVRNRLCDTCNNALPCGEAFRVVSKLRLFDRCRRDYKRVCSGGRRVCDPCRCDCAVGLRVYDLCRCDYKRVYSAVLPVRVVWSCDYKSMSSCL